MVFSSSEYISMQLQANLLRAFQPHTIVRVALENAVHLSLLLIRHYANSKCRFFT